MRESMHSNLESGGAGPGCERSVSRADKPCITIWQTPGQGQDAVSNQLYLRAHSTMSCAVIFAHAWTRPVPMYNYLLTVC